MKYSTRLRKRTRMNPSETSVVVLSDSENESEITNVVTINESDVVAESDVEVITLDDSNVNKSIVTFNIDVTPDFIPINANVLYNKPKRTLRKRRLDRSPINANVFNNKPKRTFKKRRLDSSPEVKVMKIRKCLSEDMITFTEKKIRSCRNKPKKILKVKKSQITENTNANSKSKITENTNANSKSNDKCDSDTRKPKIPQIHLSHTNIRNTLDAPRLTKGLRPVIIDGCNVAYGFGNGEFQIEGFIHVVEYFKDRGHEEIVGFLPTYYRNKLRPLDINNTIKKYEKENIIVYTPSRFVNGKLIKPYDDRFVVQYASERGGVIISNDGYLDLINEEPSWGTTIEQRIINFTFARGLLMLPKDPLGPNGPTLDEMLKFP